MNELKSLSVSLTPLASDLEYLKKEINALKIKEVIIPKVDLSSIENQLSELSTTVNNLSTTINEYKDKMKEIEDKLGGRF